jgi:hypothetical protein
MPKGVGEQAGNPSARKTKGIGEQAVKPKGRKKTPIKTVAKKKT